MSWVGFTPAQPALNRLTPEDYRHQTDRIASRIARDHRRREEFQEVLDAMDSRDGERALFLAMKDPGLAIAFMAWSLTRPEVKRLNDQRKEAQACTT